MIPRRLLPVATACLVAAPALSGGKLFVRAPKGVACYDLTRSE